MRKRQRKKIEQRPIQRVTVHVYADGEHRRFTEAFVRIAPRLYASRLVAWQLVDGRRLRRSRTLRADARRAGWKRPEPYFMPLLQVLGFTCSRPTVSYRFAPKIGRASCRERV